MDIKQNRGKLCIDKSRLRGGIANINQRKELKRYLDAVEHRKNNPPMRAAPASSGKMGGELDYGFEELEPVLKSFRKSGRYAWF
jgi:hypothetical protein